MRIAAAALLLLGILGPGCAGTSPMAEAASKRAVTKPVAKPASADEERFQSFLLDFAGEAKRAGIKDGTYAAATKNLTLNNRVRELNEQQPEFVRPVWEYLAGAVSDYRVSKGRELLDANEALFMRLEQMYGVPRTVLAAIWGMETSYGQNTGTLSLFQSLGTLAFDGPRQEYGRTQFIAGLKLVEAEHLDPARMTGSWAGAVGHTQFIPTTYLAHAIDGDGDGKRDLWNSIPDALASTANYLKESGWKPGEPWGSEVRLSDNFAYEHAETDIQKPVAEWAARGVREMTGGALPASQDMAAIILPAGARGPAFLIRNNFHAILKYNAATSYALAIGILSDRLRGRDGVIGAWPREERPLSKEQRIALQTGLEKLGYSSGGNDGVLGKRTRGALRAYQKAHAIPADGLATAALLTRILNESAAKR